MKISRKEYERLTLPWRVIDGWCSLQKPVGPKDYGVTMCEVWRLRLLYPIAWPAVPVMLALAFGFMALLVVVLPIIIPLTLLEDWLASKRAKVCHFVEWEESP